MKRKTFLLQLLLVLVVLTFSATTVIGQVVCGDVNDDGSTNIVDALLVAQCYVGLIACPDSDIGDVNCDDNINIIDALLIAQLYVGLITKLNCCDTETPTPTPTPFHGQRAIPGTIEGESFDRYGGGAGDTEANNEPSGAHVSYIIPGEWAEYDLYALAGHYYINFRTASAVQGAQKRIGSLEIDGEDITGIIDFPFTGDWANFETTTFGPVTIYNTGNIVMRINFDGDNFNFDLVQFVVSDVSPTPTPSPTPIPTETPVPTVSPSPPPWPAGGFPYEPYSYPYGASSVSIDQNLDNIMIGDVCMEYDKFKEDYITSDGASGFLRVTWPDNEVANSTVSEGIGYGMLFAVYMDDPHLLENLWNYAQLYFDGNGLMHWRITPSGSVSGSGAATDADIDMAAALIYAYAKWGLYESDARTLCNNILAHEVNSSNGVEPGDSWGGTYNPSYLGTSHFRLYADFTGNSRWLDVRDWCYNLINKCANSSTGLVPNWCNSSGTPGGGPGTPYPAEYYYDACRTPWRIALDYLHYGDSRARAFCVKISNFFENATGGEAKKIANGYHLNGNVIQADDTGEDTSFTGPVGSAAMAAGNTAWASAILERLKIFKMNQYYQDSIRLMNMLVLTGNMPNLYDMYSSTVAIPGPTPSRQDPCPLPTDPPECPDQPDPPAYTCPASNLVNNGCFDQGTVNWTLGMFGGDQDSTMMVQTGSLFIDISDDPGTMEWHVQVTQTNIQMTLGATYRVIMLARAQWPRTLQINIGQPAYPYGSYMGSEVNLDLGCEWSEFVWEFTNNLESSSGARFEINAGFFTGDVWINYIVVEQL